MVLVFQMCVLRKLGHWLKFETLGGKGFVSGHIEFEVRQACLNVPQAAKHIGLRP